MSPLSTTVSGTSTPTRAEPLRDSRRVDLSRRRRRRPVGACRRRARPRRRRRDRRTTADGVPVTPVARTSVRTSTRGSAATAWRSTHSNVVRRTISAARSASPGSSSPKSATAGMVVHPSARSASSTSGKRSRSSTTDPGEEAVGLMDLGRARAARTRTRPRRRPRRGADRPRGARRSGPTGRARARPRGPPPRRRSPPPAPVRRRTRCLLARPADLPPICRRCAGDPWQHPFPRP